MKISALLFVFCVLTLLIFGTGVAGSSNTLRSPAIGVGFRNAAAQTGVPIIVVQVTDQYGNWYNGVQVQIWQQSGPLEYTGTTSSGFYSSGDLTADLSYTVVVSSGYQTANQTVYLGTTNLFLTFNLTRLSPPSLYISGVAFTPTVISAGSTFLANMTVQNSGASTANNAFLSFSSSTPSGVAVSGSGSVIPLGQMLANSSLSVNVAFTAQANAPVGNYIVPYTITFSNITGITQTMTGSVTVPLTGVPSRPNLVIANVTFNPSVVTPGINFEAKVTIGNVGSQTSYGSGISISTGSSSISLIGSAGQASLGTIQPGQNTTVVFDMISSASAQTGAVPVPFTLLYQNNRGTQYNSSGTFNIGISSTPDLQLGQFTLSSTPLTPGLSTVLSMNVNNTGGASAYGVALTLIGNQFLSQNSSNYLGAIGSGGSSKASFFITVSNNTAPGSYNLGVSLTYKDENGVKYNSLDNFSITVSSIAPPSVSLVNTALNPAIVSPGTSGSITLFFTNSGTSSASNVIIQVTGESSLVSSKYFGLGTIGAGSQVTQVVGLNVPSKLKPGDYTLYFNATYTDSSGKVYHSSVPMEITVYNAGPSPFSAKNFAIVGGLVIVALAGALFLRKKNWI